MSEETPRVNASCLEDFKGRTIRILGKVKSLHGESCVIDANGDVTDANFEVGQFYEVIGRISDDSSVKMLQYQDFGTNIDMTNVDNLVKLQHKYKTIFYD
ncbi:hypothetical protein TRICI_005188 [Trichomonascus ciferrii]|uniref:Replication factor A protein 3 n=1 Tax=Trichomonascus ciferrii TaxID=44093 RepID=A0A642UVA1_9ASCO|nr:hypothetical protein TRICI_005188 [Trichomonascus ciferrii]